MAKGTDLHVCKDRLASEDSDAMEHRDSEGSRERGWLTERRTEVGPWRRNRAARSCGLQRDYNEPRGKALRAGRGSCRSDSLVFRK